MIWIIEGIYLGYILKEEKLENSKVPIFDFLDNIRPSRLLCIGWPAAKVHHPSRLGHLHLQTAAPSVVRHSRCRPGPDNGVVDEGRYQTPRSWP